MEKSVNVLLHWPMGFNTNDAFVNVFYHFNDTLGDLFSVRIYASVHFLHFPCYSTRAPSRFLLDSLQHRWYFSVIV